MHDTFVTVFLLLHFYLQNKRQTLHELFLNYLHRNRIFNKSYLGQHLTEDLLHGTMTHNSVLMSGVLSTPL